VPVSLYLGVHRAASDERLMTRRRVAQAVVDRDHPFHNCKLAVSRAYEVAERFLDSICRHRRPFVSDVLVIACAAFTSVAGSEFTARPRHDVPPRKLMSESSVNEHVPGLTCVWWLRIEAAGNLVIMWSVMGRWGSSGRHTLRGS
jgi:hypothetical protein